MHQPLTIFYTQMLQLDAERAGERRARRLDATTDQREIGRVNPRPPQRRPSLLRRLAAAWR